MSKCESHVPALPRGFFRTAAILLTGTGGGVIASLQPLLLGALEYEGRISPTILGRLSTAELLAMAAMAAIAGAWLSPSRIRTIGILSAGLSVAANLASSVATVPLLFAARILAGSCSGLMIWILIGFIARNAAPSRAAALYILLQTSTGLLVATLLSNFILPRHGGPSGYLALAGLGLAILTVTPLLPRSYPQLQPASVVGAIPPKGWMGLLVIMAILAGNTALWVYSGPLASQDGLPRRIAMLATTVAIASQVAGGAAAFLTGERIGAKNVMIIGAVSGMGMTATLLTVHSPLPFLIAYSALGFLWMFVVPYAVPFLLSLDGSGRAAMLTASAQIVGNAMGPFIASTLVGSQDVRAAFQVSAVLYGAAGGLLLRIGSRPERKMGMQNSE